MTHLSSLGYHTIAPDLRGYGDTSAPVSASEYTAFHIVGDIVGLLDHLGLDKVFVVGHDWGAMIAWYFCLLRPDRVKALVNMSVVFSPRNPVKKPIETLRKMFGSDYYICRFQVILEHLLVGSYVVVISLIEIVVVCAYELGLMLFDSKLVKVLAVFLFKNVPPDMVIILFFLKRAYLVI